MPQQKDLKRIVRSRMEKTGESYTTARAQVIKKRTPVPAAPAAKPTTPDYATLAGMSEETIAGNTGCGWKQWVDHLDYVGAAAWPHRDIAAHVHEKLGVSGWWAQSVTVGYERIRGLRAIGQRRDGSFEANKSRTFAVPVERLFAAFADDDERRRWLPVEVTVRKATPHRSVRLLWDDGHPCEVWLDARPGGKASAAVQHRKLPSKERADELKRCWSEWLEALATRLG